MATKFRLIKEGHEHTETSIFWIEKRSFGRWIRVWPISSTYCNDISMARTMLYHLSGRLSGKRRIIEEA